MYIQVGHLSGGHQVGHLATWQVAKFKIISECSCNFNCDRSSKGSKVEDGIADGLSSYSKDEAVFGEGGSEEEGQPHVHVLDIVLHPGIIHSKSEKGLRNRLFSQTKLRKICGPFWVILGPFWVIFGPLWAIWSHFWPFLGQNAESSIFCGIVGVAILAFRMYAFRLPMYIK